MMDCSKNLFLLLSVLLLCCCTPVDKEKEDYGYIVMEVATRGSFQYLIQIGGGSFYPENLPEDFKEADLRVKIKYREKEYHKDIYMPAPNDVPVKKFSAPVIYLTEIEKV